MEKKDLFYLVTVKVKTPEGVKPRVITEKGIIISENPKGREKAEQAALELIERYYKEKYPKYKFKFYVAADLYNYGFFKSITTRAKNEEDTATI